MSRQVEVARLGAQLIELKSKLDGIDITTLDSEEDVDRYLTGIADAYVQVKQFISRHGENRWTDWEPARWVYIERSKVALESRLTTLRRDRKTRRYQKITKTVSVIAAVVAIVASAYFAYQ